MWDTVADFQMIGTFGLPFARLHEIRKPTIAAVQGWCIAGGTDMVLNADLIVAAARPASATRRRGFGGARAPGCGSPVSGLERAKRYLFTGDEITRGGGRGG